MDKKIYHNDNSVLPNTVLLVGSGSEEKVAKICPKIIQNVKKGIFSFPILLQSFFFSKSILNQKLSGRPSSQRVYPLGELLSQGEVVWSCGLGVKFHTGLSQLRSKSSLWVAHLNTDA